MESWRNCSENMKPEAVRKLCVCVCVCVCVCRLSVHVKGTTNKPRKVKLL